MRRLANIGCNVRSLRIGPDTCDLQGFACLKVGRLRLSRPTHSGYTADEGEKITACGVPTGATVESGCACATHSGASD